jgi:hypothetical protein
MFAALVRLRLNIPAMEAERTSTKKKLEARREKKSKALEREVLIYGTTRNQVFAVIHLTLRA